MLLLDGNRRATPKLALTTSGSLAPDRNPALVYLATLSSGSRRTMRQALDVIAGLVDARLDAMTLPWWSLDYQHAAAIRTELAARYAASSANKMIAALKGVMRQAFNLRLIDSERLLRIVAVESVRGSRLPRGRSLSAGEIRALFSMINPNTNGGARDAALLAVLYAAGLRRSEVVALDLAHFDAATGTLNVAGKGNKERRGFLTNGGRAALDNWLAHRGPHEGPLFHPVRKDDMILARRMKDQSVYDVLVRLASNAQLATFSPHDLRRSFVGDLLDQGADIAVVSQLVGHAQVTTTVRYDRRGERAQAKAAELLHVPFVIKSPPQSSL